MRHVGDSAAVGVHMKSFIICQPSLDREGAKCAKVGFRSKEEISEWVQSCLRHEFIRPAIPRH